MSGIPLVSETAAARLVQLGRGREVAYCDLPAHELVKLIAEADPDRIAVDCGDCSLTYSELWSASEDVCQRLLRLGVGPGEPVGIAIHRRGRPLIPLLLGIWRAGACYVPLELRQHPIRTGRIIDELTRHGLRWVVTDDAAAADRQHLVSSEKLCATDGVLVYRPARSERREASRVDLSGAAYIAYTSGSTGQPKGAVVTHRNVTAFLRSIDAAIGAVEEEVTIATTPLTFDISLLELIWPLAAGRRVRLLNTLLDVEHAELVQILNSPGPKLLQLTPSTSDLVQLPPPPNSIRVLVGGEGLSGARAASLLSSCQSLCNVYGPTEATVWFTYHPVTATDGQAGIVGIGRPLPNCHVLILGPDRRPVPMGMMGEIYLYGPQVSSGYLDAADANASHFLSNIVEGETVYRTGDLGSWLPGGLIQFHGRVDNQVKIAGNRVELGEIEAALNEHPDVQSTVVVLDTKAEPVTVQAHVQLVQSSTSDGRARGTRSLLLDWLRVFDNEFAEMPEAWETERRPQFTLWRSFFDGSPINRTEMEEWLHAASRIVREMGARRVLDVGCGTGDLLHALGSDIDRYVGVEPSPKAIPKLRRAFSQRSDAHFVRALAHELGESSVRAQIQEGFRHDGKEYQPDCMVLNSVIQYFPSLEYLDDVMQYGFELLGPDGTLLVADLRSLPLIPSLIGKAGSAGDRRGARRRAIETELCIDPLYFVAWAGRQPYPVATWVAPKIMSASNEISDFRCDVTLSRRLIAQETRYECVPYASLGGTLDDIGSWLKCAIAKERPAAACAIPNIRHVESPAADQPLAATDLDEAFGHIPGVAIGLDPKAQEQGRLLLAYHPQGLHDWAALTVGLAIPDVVATHPWLPVTEDAIGSELWSFLTARVPVHMMPAKIRIVERFPLTTGGKVDRLALAGIEPGRASTSSPMTAAYPAASAKAASAPLVDVVVRLASAVLSAEIGPDDDFLELGGTSLDAARLAGRLWSELGWPVTAGQILRERTMRSIARLHTSTPVSTGRLDAKPDAPTRLASPMNATLPLSLSQRAFLAQAYLDTASSERMNVVVRWHIEGSFESSRVSSVIRRLVRRHRILRAVIAPSGISSILPGDETPLMVFDDRMQRKNSRDGVKAVADRPFDLAMEPPVRWCLQRIGDGTVNLYAILHHLCVDDAAIRTLHADFLAFYVDDSHDVKGDMSRLAVAVSVERRLCDERAAADKSYWLSHRGSFDRRGGSRALSRPGLSNEFTRASYAISGGAAVLRARARAANVTPFAYLLAAAAWTINAKVSPGRLVVGVAMSSRELIGCEGELGCFANMVPVCLKPSAGDFGDLVGHTAEALLAGLDHGLLPLAEISRLVQPQGGGLTDGVFDLVCQLEEMPAKATVDGTTITVSLEPSTKQMHPLIVRAEVTHDDLNLHLDVDTSLIDKLTAPRVIQAVASRIL
jgi:amino acid adenylation domain-containing protein